MITETETPPALGTSEGINKTVSPDDIPSPRDAQGPSPTEGLIGLDAIEGADRVYVVQTRETQALFAGLGLPCVCPPRPGADCDPLPLKGRKAVLVRDRAEDPDALYGIAKYADLVATACTEIVIDLVGLERDVRDTPQTIETGRLVQRHIDAEANHGRAIHGEMWRRPEPIGSALPEVPAFPVEALPDAFRDWIVDAAHRMDTPVDFVAVNAIVAAGAVIGRQCGVFPKMRDSWIVPPNLWGLCIGPPSVKKSPALEEALIGVRALEREAGEAYEVATAGLGEGQEPPPMKRYTTNDTTTEKLGELLQQNPNGLLLYRDEIVGWLKDLEKPGRDSDRAWYVESWNEKQPRWSDRIARGTGRFTKALSILGNATPGGIREYVQAACATSSGADGLMQRFQLTTYPDPREPRWIDEAPDMEARRRFVDTFRRLAHLDMGGGDDPETMFALRFSPEAGQLYREWATENAKRSRDATLSEALQSHYGKYDSLAPSLALIFELADGGRAQVGAEALERAIMLCGYLGDHAKRIYAVGAAGADPAAALAGHVEAGDLGARFSKRDVTLKGWSRLRKGEDIGRALERLGEARWIRTVTEKTGGRPRTVYEVNPNVFEDVSDD